MKKLIFAILSTITTMLFLSAGNICHAQSLGHNEKAAQQLEFIRRNLNGLTEMKLEDSEKYYESALKELKGLEEKYEGTWEALEATFYIGNVYNMMYEYKKALKYFDIVLNQEGIDKDFKARTLYFKAKSLLGVGDIVNAKKTVSELKKFEPRAANSFGPEISGIKRKGMLAPTFKVDDINGKTIDLSEYEDDIVILYFWATWCEPCHIIFPKVLDMYRNLKSKGVKFIGISLDEDLGNLLAYMNQEQIDWAQIFEGERWNGELASLYNIQNIPMMYVLDTKNKIRYIGNEIRGIMMNVATILSEAEAEEEIPLFR